MRRVSFNRKAPACIRKVAKGIGVSIAVRSCLCGGIRSPERALKFIRSIADDVLVYRNTAVELCLCSFVELLLDLIHKVNRRRHFSRTRVVFLDLGDGVANVW